VIHLSVCSEKKKEEEENAGTSRRVISGGKLNITALLAGVSGITC